MVVNSYRLLLVGDSIMQKISLSCSVRLTNRWGPPLLARVEKKHDKGKALSILAHKLGRAVYYMLKRKVAFAIAIFL